MQFLEKLSSLVHFGYSFLIALIFGIINQIIQKSHRKMKSTNFNMWPTQSKTLGVHPRKRRWSKDGPFLSFATKCKCRTTYDRNVEAIPLQLGKSVAVAS